LQKDMILTEKYIGKGASRWSVKYNYPTSSGFKYSEYSNE